MLPRPNCETATECMKILNLGLSYEETEKRLAYLAVQDKYAFNELRPARMPSRPEAVSGYISMNDRERFGFTKNSLRYFSDEEEGGRYYGNLINAKSTTKKNLEWLRTMKGIFEKDERTDLVDIVQTRLYEFDDTNKQLEPSAFGNQSQEEMAWTE